VELQLQGVHLSNPAMSPGEQDEENTTTVVSYSVQSSSPLGITEIRGQGAHLFSNPKAFETGDLPELLEKEPNNTAETANPISPPLTVNGRIGSEKDIDVFSFKSDKNQRLICEVAAQRLGSPLDPLLTLTDAAGKVLAQNDDANGMDARIDFDKFDKDQEYRLSIRDLNDRGGNKFAYRLSIHPLEPDFQVRFFPDIPRLTRGGHATVRVEVTRTGGFSGAVRVSFEGLPPGVFSEAAVLITDPPSSGLLVISAATDAVIGNFPIRLKATAMLHGKPVMHPAEPVIAGQKARRLRRGSRSTEDKVVNDAYLTVLEEPLFVIDLLSLRAEADQNQGASVDLRVHRITEFTNDIELTAEGYSADREPISKHFDIPAVSLKGDQTRAKLVLNAKSTAETGTRTIVIKGTAVINGQTNSQFSQALPLTINPIPFALESSLPRLSVTALPPGSKSAAGEAAFAIKADRRAGFGGEISLAVEGLPEGILAVFEKIPANQNETSVKITASGKAPVGKEISFNFIGTGLFNDRTYKYRTPAIKLIVIAPEETLTSANK
jgi:hypothetical protein